MKRLFTKLLKYRALTLMSVFLIAGTVSAYAEEYKSMIRQDRVWLCTSSELGEHTAKYMKFMESKDFMDKTYTRVSTIKKVIWDYGMTAIRIEEGIDETEAWMREENGKIYLLLDGWDTDPNADSSTGQYEGLLYDFNAESNSSYKGISQYRSYENDPGWYCEGLYNVSAIGTETVGDEEVKCWDVRFCPDNKELADMSTKTFRIVEGIGIVEYGGLYYLETFYLTSGGFKFYNILDCCMDLDGNILYPKDYNEELPGGGLNSSVGVVGVDADSVSYAGKMVSAHGCVIDLYDLTGKKISTSMDCLSTKGIPAGTYIVMTTGRDSSKAMKIKID